MFKIFIEIWRVWLTSMYTCRVVLDNINVNGQQYESDAACKVLAKWKCSWVKLFLSGKVNYSHM